MKKTALLIPLILISLSISACSNNQANENNSTTITNANQVVEVYYFHYSRRCHTCVTVQEQTEKALLELYPEKMESGKIVFIEVNLDEKVGEELAKKKQVSGQTLLILKGEQRSNLTTDAFMYATTNPDKLKSKIKSVVDELL